MSTTKQIQNINKEEDKTMLELFKRIRKEWAGEIEIRDEEKVYTVYLISEDKEDIIRMFSKGSLVEWENL